MSFQSRKPDYRLETEIVKELVQSIKELQDLIGIDFPWQVTANNLMAVDNETVQDIIKVIQKHKIVVQCS